MATPPYPFFITPPYATSSDLWQLALPPDSLFEESGFEPGVVGPVVHTGTGLGAVIVGNKSNPRDAWSVVIKCIRGGEIDTNFVNPGQLPQFQLSLDGGLTYGWQIYTPEKVGFLSNEPYPTTAALGTALLGNIKIQRGGFTLVLQNGTVGTPVTVGVTNASLIFTPLQAGGSITITVGAALSQTFLNGAISLVVTSTTTATQAAAYLSSFSAITDYVQIVAGGTGAGVVQPVGLTRFPFASFVSGDTWAFSTAPSIDVVAALQTASDKMNGYLSEVFHLPLVAWQNDIRQACCILARWDLLMRRGMAPKQDAEIYDPSGKLGTMAWLLGVANGNVRPVVSQQPPDQTLFSLLIRQQDPLETWSGRTFPI